MGRQKLGAFIRKIEYLKAKGGEDDSDEEGPANKLQDFSSEHEEDIGFDEIKDAYAAFESKVCVTNFPELHSGGYWVAYTTLNVLEGLMSNYVDEHEGKTKAAAETYLHALLALVKAGPNSSHVELMEKVMNSNPSIEEYVQGLDKKALISILNSLKMTFKYTKNKECDEDTYGGYIHDRFQSIFLMLSEEQCKLVQKEFLDVYLHYHTQMATLSETMAEQIDYLIRGMVEHFEDENPYIGFKDVAVIKQHLTGIKDLVSSKGYKKDSPRNNTAERTLKNILSAAVKDTALLGDVFDHVMAMLIEIAGNPTLQKEGENIWGAFRFQLFCEMEENVTPTSAMVKSCVNMIIAILPYSEVEEIETLIEKALGGVVRKTAKMSPDEVKNVLNIVIAFLQSGRKRLVEESDDMITKLKEKKSLDWKAHIAEAKQILDVIGEMPEEKMQDDKDSDLDDTVSQYKDFLEKLLEQLKKNKVLSELQPTLLAFFFNCMSISCPLKTELAEEVSSDEGYLDFSKDKADRIAVLHKCEDMLKKKDLPWSNIDFRLGVTNVLETVINSYDKNGRNVSPEENKLFVSIFKIAGDGKSIDHFYEEDGEDTLSIHGRLYQCTLMEFCSVHNETGTLNCISPIIPDILRWAKVAIQENHETMQSVTFAIIGWLGNSTPDCIKDSLPQIMDLMLSAGRPSDIFSAILQLYPLNPKALHEKLPKMFDKLDKLKENDRSLYVTIFMTVSQSSAEVFTTGMITKLFELYKRTPALEKPTVLIIVKNISEKNPKILVDFLPQLCDDKIFKPDSMNLRSGIISCIGGINERLGQQSVDYLMKYIDYSDPLVSQIVVSTIGTIVRGHIEYMQKYKARLEKLEKTSTVPQVREAAHYMILTLEGKSVENIADDLQQQQEDIADLDEKVDATVETVIAVGEKVVEHDKEIGELGEGLEKVEERVDDVEEDLGDTKIKVEEIDNKTMSNAPKWSRDLTKLMNPTAENDWRLLASRLGYNNDDIRGWATQHDPCMALLSEWYATHKTSEASFAVLTALTEMNRMDGVAIVENAMKQAEGVVEDEEFEYPSPPPVFISYQWGFQDEVKLLKQHLNMAGYECWLDVGQMGGGDKLFAKIDNGIRGAKIVICCVTEKYAKSPNCNREVNLSVNLNKPIIPLLMEKMDWPPVGSMGPIFSEYLFIRFFQRGGEETGTKDQRYWPIPKFQELLMQLNFFVVPDQKLVKKEYANWWAPMVEDIVIDKNKGKKQTASKTSQKSDSQVAKTDETPLIFLSYQWGKQPQIKELYKRLTSLGYTVWMDIFQMGGGDSLYDKIDRGMRGCKAVVSCVTLKYSLSANCRREISLADALKKPIIPLLLEQIKWPPDGPMSMVFTELLFINFYREEAVQMSWKGEKFDELKLKLGQFIPEVNTQGNDGGNTKTPALTSAKKDATPSSTTGKAKADNKDKGKDAPKSATNTNSKGAPNSKTQVNNSKTEPKPAASSPKSSATSKQNPKPAASPKASATNKTSTVGQDQINKTDGNTAEVKPKAVSNQNETRNTTKQTANGTTKSEPAKSKSCAIL